MRILSGFLLICLISLQVKLWAGDGSFAEVWRLQQAIERQTRQNGLLSERNQRLVAQVQDLKTGLATVEALARRELGLIGPGETFFLVVD
ncbi:MAG: cell division protein FtsB [Gammaproteobacteria bacterium]|nr:cell division protein FtsB [Gammaproteobacteria bacterium]